MQSEYSLFTRDSEAEVLPACRALEVSFVPYSPLGRGLLTGALTKVDNLEQNNFRRLQPRMQDENLAANLKLVEAVKALAAAKGCAPGQLALAWLLHQGDDIIPIPGTRRLKYLEENVTAADVRLPKAELDAISAALPPRGCGRRALSQSGDGRVERVSGCPAALPGDIWAAGPAIGVTGSAAPPPAFTWSKIDAAATPNAT